MSIEPAVKPTTFPEAWDEPFDDGAPFMFDPMHTPHPLTPLTQTALGSATGYGLTTAAREARLPIQGYEVRHRNYFHYTRFTPTPPPPAEEAEALGREIEAASRTEVERMMERWHGEHLPRVTALHQQMRALDPSGATSGDLLQMIDEAQAIARELWTIHFRVGLPMLLAMQLFDELYADLFGGSDADAHALLVGGISGSVRAGFGLSDLAIAARERGLAPLILETPVEQIVPALRANPAGAAFLDALTSYLEEYGLRQDLFELATPTWQEDPSFALAALRGMIESGRDARADHAAIARAADAALDAARERLAHYPEPVRQQFEAMVQLGWQGAFLQEEHNFYIDQQGIAQLRLFFLRVADWLRDAGWIAVDDDIFLLTLDEVRAIIADEPTPETVPAIRETIARRRDELAQARLMMPLPFIGAPPDAPEAANPMERAMLRFFGGPPQASQTPGELKGTPGSRGVASGPARVARTLDEARALRPGEVLVAITTMPPWTPLFGIAAAVVTETGGPLSHCAIVAREYGLPAVVGVFGATRAITTGQVVTVDGDNGIVTFDA